MYFFSVPDGLNLSYMLNNFWNIVFLFPILPSYNFVVMYSLRWGKETHSIFLRFVMIHNSNFWNHSLLSRNETYLKFIFTVVTSYIMLVPTMRRNRSRVHVFEHDSVWMERLTRMSHVYVVSVTMGLCRVRKVIVVTSTSHIAIYYVAKYGWAWVNSQQ